MSSSLTFFFIAILFFPALTFSQSEMTVRVIDIAEETGLDDFTLTIIRGTDTSEIKMSSESAPIRLLPGETELIVNKEGYPPATTAKWDCPSDTATIMAEFRLIKVNAPHSEVRKARRHSRKMGIDNPLNTVPEGGFQRVPHSIGKHYLSLVYMGAKDWSSVHTVSE